MSDATSGRPDAPIPGLAFGGERLECYRVALEFQVLAGSLEAVRARSLLLRLVQMLSRLIVHWRRMESPRRNPQP